MCDKGAAGRLDCQVVALLKARLQYLERRLASQEPGSFWIDDLLNGPQRQLSPSQVEKESRRLLAICARNGVMAVIQDAATCRELLPSLADACHRSGLKSDGQYLAYLLAPYPYD
jgi:cytosine/adenosine deaminase-related metal-dependent hydrolase